MSKIRQKELDILFNECKARIPPLTREVVLVEFDKGVKGIMARRMPAASKRMLMISVAAKRGILRG